MRNGRHIAEFYGVGAALTFVGGFLDAYTFICRDGVFANAQTGNIILFGLNLTDGNFGRAVHYLIPIISFIVGVLAVEFIKHRFNDHPDIHWHQLTLILEMAIILGVGFIPESHNNIANVMVSLTCAMQVEGFRRLNGNAYATTMCTGNLRSGTENLFEYLSTKDKKFLDKAWQYYSIILIFIIGAVCGAVLTRMWGIKTVLICLIGHIITLMILRSDNKKKNGDEK